MSAGGFKNAAMKRPAGANSRMTGKVKPNGIREGGSQFGTTIEHSDPAKFRNTGSSQAKKRGGDNVTSSPHGTTFVCDESHVKMPSADLRPDSVKTIGKSEPELKTSGFKTAGERSASQKSGDGEPTTRGYPLKKGYEKKGKGDKKSHSIF